MSQILTAVHPLHNGHTMVSFIQTSSLSQYHYKNEIFHVALTHWPKSSGLEPRGGPIELLLDVH